MMSETPSKVLLSTARRLLQVFRALVSNLTTKEARSRQRQLHTLRPLLMTACRDIVLCNSGSLVCQCEQYRCALNVSLSPSYPRIISAYRRVFLLELTSARLGLTQATTAVFVGMVR